jgi:hypothetical protein
MSVKLKFLNWEVSKRLHSTQGATLDLNAIRNLKVHMGVPSTSTKNKVGDNVTAYYHN